ncbi:serine/threonine-protein kinase AFC2-like isoform X1 [Phragmites australis]|uniref:serine/threonine-protein kinase AFC2-like isoform X1 n=2 Tax=Phragmites australis TaxID=29695 RepID=UPI002D79780E|nr:serine/threonine-protein kinase AFC2-like isoform X1 [Phragmites australis]
MAMECAAAADLSTGRPRKRARLGWDVPPAAEAQIRTFCGQEVGDVASLLLSARPSGHTCSSLLPKGVARNASPPWREDDKDGHYIFAVGENLTSRYKIYRKIGKGTFGQVLECWDRENKEMVAIKIVRAVKKYSDAAMIEIDVLQKLARNGAAGKHCVQIRNWFDYRSHICIVCEKLGPSLYDFLWKTGYRPFPIDLVRQIGEQLLESVAFLHCLQLIHTDLKPENILLVSSDYVKPKDGSFSRKLPKSSAIKLIDFGSTTYHHQDLSYIVSTRHYRAPEVILGHGWSYPCDIWSVGCILVELCSGETLFQTHDNLEHLAMMERVLGPLRRNMLGRADHHVEKYIRRGRLNWPEGATTTESIRVVHKLPRLQNLVMQHVDHSAGEFIDLLKGLVAYEPSARLTAQEALSHRFFTGYGDRRSL